MEGIEEGSRRHLRGVMCCGVGSAEGGRIIRIGGHSIRSSGHDDKGAPSTQL